MATDEEIQAARQRLREKHKIHKDMNPEMIEAIEFKRLNPKDPPKEKIFVQKKVYKKQKDGSIKEIG